MFVFFNKNQFSKVIQNIKDLIEKGMAGPVSQKTFNGMVQAEARTTVC